jgi:hypothetical protein
MGGDEAAEVWGQALCQRNDIVFILETMRTEWRVSTRQRRHRVGC